MPESEIHLGASPDGDGFNTLRIETIGMMPRKAEIVRRRFSFHGFGIVFQGSGFYQVDFGPRQEVKAPAIFHIGPGPVYHYGPEAGGVWAERYLCFSGPRVADWLNWGWLPGEGGVEPIAKPAVLEQMHRSIAQALASAGGKSLDRAKLEVEQMVYEIHEQSSVPPRELDAMEELIRRWTRAPEAAEPLREAAQSLKMSYSSFGIHFRRRTGYSPHQFLTRLRIENACVRLAQTSEPVKVIALESRFRLVENFNRTFRRLKGMTPTEFRHRAGLSTIGVS